jgi:hypothetical protein
LDAPEKFKLVIKDLASQLKSQGFKLKGTQFSRETECNYQCIGLQKNRNLDGASTLEFCVNFGVGSKELMREFEGIYFHKLPKPPGLAGCVFTNRLNSLAVKEDLWWTVDAASNVEAVTHDIWGKLNSVGLLWLEKLGTDFALQTRLLALFHEGVLSDNPMLLRFLAALLRNSGDRADLKVVVDYIEGPKGPKYRNDELTQWVESLKQNL